MKDQNLQDLEPGKGYEFEGNGKTFDDIPFDSVYRMKKASTISLPVVSESVRSGLKNQLKILNRKNALKPVYGNLAIDKKELSTAIETLLQDSVDISKLSFYQICGEDSLGNVHYTGYYTPVLKVKEEPDSIFRFPFYKKPTNWKGRLPSREAIDRDGVLKGHNLELAWTDDILAIYFMQVQGSGLVEYPDGRRALFAYGGSNGYKYKSLGKYLVYHGYITPEQVSMEAITDRFHKHPDSLATTLFYNPSYIFFRETSSEPAGSTGVPLLPGHSVAVDPVYIPYGAVLLGKIPILDDRGILKKHEFRLLLPQDTGGAIRGTGHIDLYMGTGLKGGLLASAMHHYGKLYLILGQ